MRGRKLWRVVVLALLALVAVGVCLAWPRPARITRENFRLIRDGMSRAELEGSLGPPGDYRTVLTEKPPFWWLLDDGTSVFDIPYDAPPPVEEIEWYGDQGEIRVLLCPDGVAKKDFIVTQKVAQSPLDNLLWRAKRQWYKWFPEK